MNKSMLAQGVSLVAVTFSAPLVAAPVLPQTAIYDTAVNRTVNGLSTGSGGTASLSPGQFSISGTQNDQAYSESSPGVLVSTAVGGSGTSDYSYLATSSFTGNYVNGAASADYTLNFLIGSGYLYAGLMDTLMPGAFNQNTSASYSLEILLNGSAIWSSNLALQSQICKVGGFCPIASMYGGEHPLGATTTLSTSWGAVVVPAGTYNASGFPIPNTSGPTQSYSAFYGYKWDQQNLSLDLGIMDPFEAFSLEYVMTAKVQGYTDGAGISRSGAKISDPFGIDGGFGRLEATPLATVPEPPMLALLGLGLLGLAASLRRKQQAASGSLRPRCGGVHSNCSVEFPGIGKL